MTSNENTTGRSGNTTAVEGQKREAGNQTAEEKLLDYKTERGYPSVIVEETENCPKCGWESNRSLSENSEIYYCFGSDCSVRQFRNGQVIRDD